MWGRISILASRMHNTSSHQLPEGVSAPGHRRVVNNSFQLIAYRQPRKFSGIRGSCDRVLVQFSEILSNLWDRPPSGNSIGLVGCECLCLAAAGEQRHLDCMSASNKRRVDSRIVARVHLLACGRNGLGFSARFCLVVRCRHTWQQST